jgi:hypothetical protein
MSLKMADDSAVLAAAAAAAASGAVAAASGAAGQPHGNSRNHAAAEDFSATAALVSYLRMEADMAEEKARKLRDQATAMALQFGVTVETQVAYGEY